MSDLTRSVTGQGLRVWFDVMAMSAGENYVREIDEAIAASDCVAVVVSPYSMASVEVQREIKVATGLGKRIVPVLLQAAQMPEELRVLQWIDFRREYEQPMAMLLAFIRGEARPVEAALALKTPPRPLNLGDRATLAQLDCPVMVKLPLIFALIPSIALFGLSMKFTFESPVVPILGLAFYGVMLVAGFRAARRKLTYPDSLILIWGACMPVIILALAWRDLQGKALELTVLFAAAAVGVVGASMILVSRRYRRWMVAYSHEPGQKLFRLR